MKIINGIEFRTKEEKIIPIEKTKPLNLRFSDSICSDAENMTPEQYTRRTITIAPLINRWIQSIRANVLNTYPDKEIDYTTAANYLMAIGINFIQKYKMTNEDLVTINQLLGNFKQLEQHGILDLYDSIARDNINK